MSGQLPSRTRVYDNAAEFASDIPTYAHHLRRAGYQTSLSGKMHFVGPDQLHGYEERLTTDIYPADYGWTPDYARPGERIDWWYHNLGSIKGAGVAEITNQLEYDDEVTYHATRKLYDLARGHDARPWCLTVSFTHPHDPYVMRKRFWDLYADCAQLDPAVAPIPFEEQDAHSKRLMLASDYASYPIIRRGRAPLAPRLFRQHLLCRREDRRDSRCAETHAPGGRHDRGLPVRPRRYAGRARHVVQDELLRRIRPRTVDDRGSGPRFGLAPGRIDTPVSTLDVLPTLAELAGIDLGDISPWTDGESLVGVAAGTAERRPVPMEYAAEGSVAPMVALRDGRFKLVLCEKDEPQLFDLESDPHELKNLACDPAHADMLDTMTKAARARWDLPSFDAEVRASQARRHVVYEALRNGAYYPWDHQPLQLASERYMRNHMDLNVLEEAQRFPRGE